LNFDAPTVYSIVFLAFARQNYGSAAAEVIRRGNGQVQDVGQNQRTTRAVAAGQEGVLRVGPTNLLCHVSFLKIVT